jgi:carbon-monoxide dehydrogenase medium subunit
MKPAPFEYHRPASLDETFDLLDRYGDDGRLLAGGQSLVPALNLRLATPRAVIDINRVPDLDAVDATAEGLVIGALVRQAALERSPLVREHAPLVAAAVRHVGHAAIRARGTVGGSLALADPAAELPACAVALEATIRLGRRGGQRDIAAVDFFRGVYTTALAPGEIVLEMRLPRPGAGWRWSFEELARRHGDFAVAGAAVAVEVDGDGRVVRCGIGLLGLGSTPERGSAAEAAVLGGLDDAEEIGRLAVAELDSIPSDLHGSAGHRRRVGAVAVARAWTRASTEARGG